MSNKIIPMSGKESEEVLELMPKAPKEIHEDIEIISETISLVSKRFLMIMDGIPIIFDENTVSDAHIILQNADNDEEVYEIVKKFLQDPAMAPHLQRYGEEVRQMLEEASKNKLILPDDKILH